MGQIFVPQFQLEGNKPLLEVSLGVTQTISAATTTFVHFTSVEYDNFAGYNSGTFIYTTPWSGQYRITGTVLMSSTPTGAATPNAFALGIYTASGTVLQTESFVYLNETAATNYLMTVAVEAILSCTGGVTNIGLEGSISAPGTCQYLANGLASSMRIEYIQP
jgi:hypothetical protein